MYRELGRSVAQLAMAPLYGALFLIFLPAVGFIMLGYALALKAAEGMIALDEKTKVA